MTIYYVGPGGSNSANGQSWVNRKLTINGAEDIPVVPGDTVYVAPGVYREQFDCDVSGSSGSLITYIGDRHGISTDGIGGHVRITGSDDDRVGVRGSCIDLNGEAYRTFRGFRMGYGSSRLFNPGTSTGAMAIIIEDCVFDPPKNARSVPSIWLNEGSAGSFIIRRCWISGGLTFSACDVDVTVENCILSGKFSDIIINEVIDGDILINNCLLVGTSAGTGIDGSTATINGSVSIYNSLFLNWGTSMNGVTGFTEDYNSLAASGAVTGFTGGANSDSYPALFDTPILYEGFPREYFPFMPADYSPIARIAGTSEATDDFFGITRPTTSSKKSRGPVQIDEIIRATSPVYGTSSESLEMPDANRHQVHIPVTATSTTISMRVYREANYAGTLPQMVIREPGQSDLTTTDTGSVSTWNLLTDTFTPDGSAGFVAVEIVNNNTATSGSYSTFWAELKVAA